MIRVACPGCRRHLRAPAALAGSRVTCPRCGAEVDVPLPDHLPEEAPAAGVRVTAPARDSGGAGDLEHAPPATRLGVVALGLGLLSVAVLCLPYIGYGSLLLSGAGLLLGLWALVHALRRGAGEEGPARGAAGVGGRGLSYPLAGTLACLVALLLALLPFLLGPAKAPAPAEPTPSTRDVPP